MRTVRALSSGNITEYEMMDESHFKNAPDRPIHQPTQSLFTSSSGFNNFRGIFNWGCFLLLITTSRMALENVIKYGIVMDPSSWLRFILQTPDKHLALGLLLCCNLFIFLAWLIERSASRRVFGDSITVVLACSNLIIALIFPTLVIWCHDFNPLFSSPVLAVYTILFLKLWSYAAVNRWCRSSQTCLHDSDVFLSQLLEERKVADKQTSASFEGSTATNLEVSKNVQPDGQSTQDDSTHVRLRSMVKADSLVDKRFTTRLHSLQTGVSTLSARDRFRATRVSAGDVGPYHSMLDAIEVEPCGAEHISESQQVARNRYVTYPHNLTLGHLYYFIFAPTLCYELNFPRTLGIRKQFLLRRLFEVVFINQLILCLAQQWMLPLLKNSVTSIGESNLSQIVERCLKLAIPNHFLWLLLFFSTFHSFLNLLAELTRFGDRFFYSDWWNAETVPAFWSKWNIPVHRFARRHIYLPLVDSGFTRPQAGMVVFFISALLHEFLVSVPLKMPRMWAFLCMFSQMPYAKLVNYLFPQGGAWGNVAVWLTLIIGQPLIMLFYFHDYYVQHYTK